MSQLLRTVARLLGLADRLLPALLMAASVTLLAAGLLWYGSPGATRSDPFGYAAVRATTDAGVSPAQLPSAVVTAAPATSRPTPRPSAGETASPSASPSARPGGSPTPTGSGGTSPSPTNAIAVATRIVIPALSIDLPVVSGDTQVPNQGPAGYPPCDVALFHPAFVQPGEAGTTYIYAHARDGMFLPLLAASEQQNGASIIGALVEVYTDDDERYVYAISAVKRHAIDFSIAEGVPPGVHQLVLQTSEGPRGTVPKLQVLAEFQDVLKTSHADAHPKPKPRGCYDTP